MPSVSGRPGASTCAGARVGAVVPPCLAVNLAVAKSFRLAPELTAALVCASPCLRPGRWPAAERTVPWVAQLSGSRERRCAPVLLEQPASRWRAPPPPADKRGPLEGWA